MWDAGSHRGVCDLWEWDEYGGQEGSGRVRDDGGGRGGGVVGDGAVKMADPKGMDDLDDMTSLASAFR